VVVTRDAGLIYAAAFVRSATVSLVGVTLAIYLSSEGFSTTQIGLLIGVGLAGTSVATLVVGLHGDAWGRRRVFLAVTALTAIGYIALAVTTDPGALILVAFAGMLNGMGRDRGALSALDQAILPGTVPDAQRTWALAWYHLVLDAGHAVGALGGTLPTILRALTTQTIADAHRTTYAFCAGAILLSIVPYLALSTGVEVPKASADQPHAARLDPRSRRAVTRIALLFGLDSIGTGFLNASLIAYWFFERYGTSEAQAALLFFAARGLNAVSHVAAAWMSRRIGLLNTMVWTHLPSSLLLMVAPASPSAAIAAALFLAREALVEMDVPTRQSYVMAIVKPSERTRASSVTNVTRNVGWAVGPPIAGMVMQHVALAGPLLIGGGMKILYDLLLYRSFRDIRPPEEDRATGSEHRDRVDGLTGEPVPRGIGSGAIINMNSHRLRRAAASPSASKSARSSRCTPRIVSAKLCSELGGRSPAG
jgi:MFS family permease